jgi:hypothetical protein
MLTKEVCQVAHFCSSDAHALGPKLHLCLLHTFHTQHFGTAPVTSGITFEWVSIGWETYVDDLRDDKLPQDCALQQLPGVPAELAEHGHHEQAKHGARRSQGVHVSGHHKVGGYVCTCKLAGLRCRATEVKHFRM